MVRRRCRVSKRTGKRWKRINITTFCFGEDRFEAERERPDDLQEPSLFASHILPPEVADTRLSDLKMVGIFRRMNSFRRKRRRFLSPAVQTLLRFCLQHFEDFGQAYAVLWLRWYMDESEAMDDIRACRNEYYDFWSGGFANDAIRPPRRIWDVVSNRVVPSWVNMGGERDTGRKWEWISVSWPRITDDGIIPGTTHMTSINGREWPVNIPFDSTMQSIRIELLNLAVNLLDGYSIHAIWLDRFCSSPSESEEFKHSGWELCAQCRGSGLAAMDCKVYYNYKRLDRKLERKTHDIGVGPPPGSTLFSYFADAPLSHLGVRGVLSLMNSSLQTKRSLSVAMSLLLRFCLCIFKDFGQAYTLLRAKWHMDPSEALDCIRECRSEYDQFWSLESEDALAPSTKLFRHPIAPRRLWDIRSNRVVPSWVLLAHSRDVLKWTAVFHSRMYDYRRQRISSSINGREWPIPIPIDSTLEAIHIDLLHKEPELDINFFWVDVLCMRQEGVPGMENLRESERKLDHPIAQLTWLREVPMTVHYKNGLGRPSDDSSVPSLSPQDADFSDVSGTYPFVTTTVEICSCGDKMERENMKVPSQDYYIGPSCVLPSKTANTLLSDLGSTGILRRMNAIFRTDRDLVPEMERLLQFSLDTFRDFGEAYACLRPRWNMNPLDALQNIEARREEDWALRARALENDIVVRPYCPPRRLWDLCSNRVMPFWTLQVDPFDKLREWCAISHSWMEEKHRHNISSPVNGQAWPVPIPKDTSLERIRVELLNLVAKAAREADAKAQVESMNVEARRRKGFIGLGEDECRIAARIARVKAYGRFVIETEFNSVVWLDVLCLRQEGMMSKEEIRKEEWRLDVPIIGPIFNRADWTVYYFSGLGRPFEAPTNKTDPRHWMNRAWTLQETQQRILVAGQSPTSPKIPYSANLGHNSRDWRQCLEYGDEHLKALMSPFIVSNRFSAGAALILMRERSGTSDLDKIAGLIFRLNGFDPPLPAYIVGERTEDAWDRLIKATRPRFRAELFFLFPRPGMGRYLWYPSWKQILDIDAFTDNLVLWGIQVDFDKNGDSYSIYCCSLENCRVEGLYDIGPGGHDRTSSREGKVRVVDKGGEEHYFPISAVHETSIPDGSYTLVGYAGPFGMRDSYWVVARKTVQGFVEKVSVIRFEGQDTCHAIENIANSFGKTTLLLR